MIADAFFDSNTWILARNLAGFIVVVFWLTTAFWVYKDARRRIDDLWLVVMAAVLGLVPPFIGPIVYLFLRSPDSIVSSTTVPSRSGWPSGIFGAPCAAAMSTRRSSSVLSARPD